LAPGVNITDKYIPSLPSGVTLTDHEPIISPWILIATVTSVPMADPVDVSSYPNIAVFNASDDTATISANTDNSNQYSIVQNVKEIFSNETFMFGCIEVLSMGSGSVYIYGVK
jgi:hypothetical protein